MSLASSIKIAARWVGQEKYLEQQLPLILGDWFFVCPGLGASTNTGLTIAEALDSIETAYDKVSNGDGICLLSYGTTTAHTTSYLVAAIDWSKSNITVVGIAAPTRYAGRARISQLTASLATLITVSGNNNRFYNLHLANFGTTGTGCLSVTGDRNYFYNLHCIGGGGVTTASVADMDLSLGGDENTFEQCVFGSDTFDKEDLVGFNMEFANQSFSARNRFYDCEFNQYRAAGSTAGAISFNSDGASITRMQLFDHCLFAVYDDGTPAINKEAAVVIGIKPNNGYIVFKDCMRVGFTDWSGTGLNTSVFTNSPVGHEAGGAGVIANPS